MWPGSQTDPRRLPTCFIFSLFTHSTNSSEPLLCDNSIPGWRHQALVNRHLAMLRPAQKDSDPSPEAPDAPIFICSYRKYLWSTFVVQSLSHVRLFVIPWSAAHQAPLSFTISWSLLKLMSTESVMPSNHLIPCHPLLLLPSSFLTSGSFLMSRLFVSGGQSIGASASASVLPISIQG